MSAHGNGRLTGVGAGPGDPELLTLKAVRALREADVVAHFAKRGRASHARASAAGFLAAGVEELPLLYPVTTEIDKGDSAYVDSINAFYDDSAARIAACLDAGKNVAVLSEGDPLFYGSYMHMHTRLAPRYDTRIIPGVTAMAGCWAQAGAPIAQGDDVLCVLPGTLPEAELARRLADCDAAVIMKVGRNLPKIRRALERSGQSRRALYVERGTMEGTSAVPLMEKLDDAAPYFSLILLPGWGARA